MSEQPANTELVAVPTKSSEPDIGRLLLDAVDKGLTTEQLQVLADLQCRMEDRRARAAFNHAMARFRADCPQIFKSHTGTTVTKTGARFTYEYSTLADIANVINPVLAKYGLSYRWGDAVIEQQYIRISCIVTHEEGHTESSSVPMPYASSAGSSEQQKWCSATTFARRQSLVGALGLTMCEVDTDGNDPASDEKITETQARELQDLLDTKDVNVVKFLAWANKGPGTLASIPAHKYDEAIRILQTKEPKK